MKRPQFFNPRPTRQFEGEDTKLRRISAFVMFAAVGMVLIALVVAGLFFKGQADSERVRSAAAVVEREELRAELRRSTMALEASLQAEVRDDEDRAQAIKDTVKQVSDELAISMNALFAAERKLTKAESDRQVAAIRAAQADLERRIAAIQSGPAGPAGATGRSGPAGASKSDLCLINCQGK